MQLEVARASPLKLARLFSVTSIQQATETAMNSRRKPHLHLLSLALCALISACGGGGGGGATNGPITDPAPRPITGGAPTEVSNPAPANPAPTTLSDAQAKDIAMRMWRNDNLQQHPKGSCAGCHGADFFDLARIGSTDADLTRRAELDGATTEQAQALVQAVRKMRTDFAMPATNARQFRPFQPGGAVLLPQLPESLQTNVARDVAFAEQLEKLLPTLYGERIATLGQAKKAQAELLDIAKGTNTAGANPTMLNLRKLPTGVQYPLWSADLHHGATEGTFNDWTADIAHDAKPETKAAWHALQNTYLANPSNENFWRMYNATRSMTQLPLLGQCNVEGAARRGLACEATDDFNKHKFLSALKGQHMIRLEAAGKLETFFSGAIAFSYMDKPEYDFFSRAPKNALLPADMWEIGDRGRVILETTEDVGSFKSNLTSLGYPLFAQNSIDANRSAAAEKTALQKAWFWFGFTLDPSFARIHGSNATKSGEYMVGTLVEERMFNHMHFSALMRLVTKGSLQEANMKNVSGISRPQNDVVRFMANYSYATGYSRVIASKLWNEDKNIQFDDALQAKSEALYAKLVGNGFRMSLLLQTDALDNNSAFSASDRTALIDIMSNKTNGGTIYGLAYNMHDHFKAYHTATRAADEAMIKGLLAKLNITAPQGF